MKVLKNILNCKKCELHNKATNKVPGTGNYNADIMIILEAPGKQEDKFGYPVIGKSGIMLNKILKEIGINRNVCFITNILKCRPPKNRDPKPNEIKKCTPHLISQIKTIKPKIILTFGKFASCFVLHKDRQNTTMKELMQKIYKIKHSIKVVPMYHPSYLLMNGSRTNKIKPQIKEIKRILCSLKD